MGDISIAEYISLITGSLDINDVSPFFWMDTVADARIVGLQERRGRKKLGKIIIP